jgi:hypothetical protein
MVASAHSADSSTMGVAAFEHSTFASEIAVVASRTTGAASAWASAVGSSVGVRRTS